jgi:hypothetical protein
MTEKTYKVGDVVAWEQVPSGALVRTGQGRAGFYLLRVDEHGSCVGATRGRWSPFVGEWKWSNAADDEQVTIITLGLTGQETAADLQRMAEVFEVREAVKKWSRDEWAIMPKRGGMPGLLSDFVHNLHAAGWRPGDAAEDAALFLRMPFTCAICGDHITNREQLRTCQGGHPVL